MKKDMKGGTCEGGCGVCKCCYWVFPLILLLIAFVPGWLTAGWTQWAIAVIAVLMLLKKKCPCNK